jgi:hypothetical protein
MLAILLVWVNIGITAAAMNPVTHERSASATSREWTNASGTKHVWAVLLRVEGDTLWLRRSDGKLATTTISQLSKADREYVARNPPRTASDSTAESKPNGIATKIADKVQSMAELPGWTKGSQPENPKRLVPAALVYVRVSRQFLEDYVERSVRQTRPVTDVILGARVRGQSHTRGNTNLELLPSSGRLSGRIAFDGTVHADTRAYKGPVILHQFSDSTFRSSKLISFDEKGLRVTRARTVARTDVTTTSIDTCLPRLRGRIARRIAWRRVAGSQRQAESITAQHTAARISRDFDERIDRSVAKVKEVFRSKTPQWKLEGQEARTEMRFRSSANSVEMAVVRREATTEERQLRPPKVDGNPDVAVRMHRAMLTRAMIDPKVQTDLAPLFLKLLNARFARSQEADSKAGKESPADTSKWSFDLDWLALDFTDSAR